MAIPNNYIDKITDHDSGQSRDICPAADKVRVGNENFEGTDLDQVLDEVAAAIEEGGGGYAPPPGGIPKTDLAQGVQDSLDAADSAYQKPASGIPSTDMTRAVQDALVEAGTAVQPGDSIPATDVTGLAPVATSGDYDDLQNKPTIPTVPSDIVQSVSVNGGSPTTPDGNGNVNLSVTVGQEISLLFIGNSLTQDAVAYLPLVLKEIAQNLTFNIYMWYDGGSTLTQILGKWNNNNAAEIFSTCENVTSWTNVTTQTMSAFLASGKTFDIVCLEEYFNYKRAAGYTAEDKQSFNDAVAYIRSHYGKPFKVVSFFHRPLCKDTNNQVDLSIADEVFGLTYDGVRWQLENTISEGVVPSGIASYRAMYDNVLNVLGDKGYMSPDGTHSQEGLPCLMQAWVTALWVLNELSIPESINNVQGRVTNSNYQAINVPGANLGTGVVVGTTAQDQEAMDVAIKAYKEGKKMEEMFITPFGVPAYKIVIGGASGTKDERNVKLSASLLPTDAQQADIVWSIVSGTATVDNNGVVTYSGSALTASVVVRAKVNGYNLQAEATLSFALAAVETPVFSPAAGEYAVGQAVTISCATEGATIYYTTDGSTPTSASTQYSSPITINADTTINAIAILGNESSNVATAEYTVATPKAVTVNVSDGENAVSGADVVLNNGTSDIQPTSSSGGAYVFSVIAGAYTIKVSKTGFIPSETSIQVSGNTSKNVTIRSTDLLRYALVTNAGCMGNNTPSYPLYPPIIEVTDYSTPTQGAYMSVYTANSRSGIVIDRSKAEMPVTWQNFTGGDANYGGAVLTEAKSLYSLIEWPLDVDEIEIKMTNSDYYLAGRVMSKSNSDLARYDGGGWVQGGQNCVLRLSRTTYPTAFYVNINLKYLAAGTTWGSPSIADLGLSVKAIVE